MRAQERGVIGRVTKSAVVLYYSEGGKNELTYKLYQK